VASALVVLGSLVLGSVVPGGAAGAQSSATARSASPGTAGRATGSRLVTPVFSARRIPYLLRSSTGDAAVATTLAKALEDAPAETCAVVAERGRVVASGGSTGGLLPASTNKLLTSYAAIEILGPDTRLRTTVRVAMPPVAGVVSGNLFLVGGGDPLLFTPGFRVTLKDQNQAGTEFSRLADRIKAAGITEVTGNIVGDDSRYDAERAVATWSPSYQKTDAVGALSALNVNRGISGLSKDPDKPATNRLVGDPPVLSAETLQSYLRARGITVRGQPVAGVAPPDAVELTSLDSLPVKDLAAEVLTWSDNTAAELLTKEIGLAVSKVGSTAAGTAAIADLLRRRGFPLSGLLVADGSGLDRNNRLDCRLLVSVLDGAGQDSPLAAGLAVAGRSGTLRTRFRNTPADGRLHAKTGTLNDVSALAGFAVPGDGSVLTFAMVVNGQPPPKVPATSFEDALVLGLFSLPPAAPIDALGPKPAT